VKDLETYSHILRNMEKKLIQTEDTRKKTNDQLEQVKTTLFQIIQNNPQLINSSQIAPILQ
jgi:hypothetical protein